MKKLFIGIYFCMIALIFSSCGNQNKSSENQSVTEPTSQNKDSISTEAAQNTSAEQNQNTQQNSPAHNTIQINGHQIVENISNKLNDKLNLSEEQFNNIKSALSKKFEETNGDLNKMYEIETGKRLGRDVRLKSAAEISSILNVQQREQFEKFMNK